MADYIGAATSLLESNTRAGTATQQIDAQRGMKNQELLQSAVNNTADATVNLRNADEQRKNTIALENLKSQAEAAKQLQADKAAAMLKQQELEAQAAKSQKEHYFTPTKQILEGVKSNFGLDLSSLEGQEVRADVFIATLAAAKAQNVAGIGAKAKVETAGKTGKDTTSKELLALERQITANTAQIQKMAKDPNFPQEAFGGEPGNLDKALQYISAGQFGNLSASQKTQIKQFKDLADQLQSQKERAAKLRGAGTAGETGGPTADSVAEGFGF